MNADRAADFRKAARRILRDSSLGQDERSTALLRLFEIARRETCAEFAAGAIVAEIGWDHDQGDVLAQRSIGDPLERTHRRLRGRGYERCPECLTVLSNEVDWVYWSELRRAAIAEAEAREGATT